MCRAVTVSAGGAALLRLSAVGFRGPTWPVAAKSMSLASHKACELTNTFTEFLSCSHILEQILLFPAQNSVTETVATACSRLQPSLGLVSAWYEQPCRI